MEPVVNREVLFMEEQSLHSTKVFSALINEVGDAQEDWRWHTGDSWPPKYPQGCSITYGVILINNSGGKGEEGRDIQSVGTCPPQCVLGMDKHLLRDGK